MQSVTSERHADDITKSKAEIRAKGKRHPRSRARIGRDAPPSVLGAREHMVRAAAPLSARTRAAWLHALTTEGERDDRDISHRARDRRRPQRASSGNAASRSAPSVVETGDEPGTSMKLKPTISAA